MRYTMFVGITDKQADEAVSYLTAMFNPDSTLPRSPADMPGYKDLAQHFPPEALNMVYVEYDTGPGRFPWDCNPDKDGNIWVPYYSQVNTVARLNPKTGEFKEYPLPQQPRVAIHSAYPGPDGNVWFTEQLNNRLGKIDPQTGEVTEYQDVKPSNRERIGDTESNVSIYYRPHEPSKHTIRVDPRGIVWASGTPFSRFDPKTKQFTEYPDPFNTYGVALNKDGSEVWFDGFVPEGKIYRIDALTGKITGSWQPPTHGLPRRIQVADDGIVWFNEFEGGKIGRFDPKTETFKEFQLPGARPTPYALGIDRDNMVWYSSEDMDEVGRLDPNTGKITEYPFPHMENKMREFTMDAQGRMWWASPANNKVGYFYLANSKERASK
jgi:virginiamycin B lyase